MNGGSVFCCQEKDEKSSLPHLACMLSTPPLLFLPYPVIDTLLDMWVKDSFLYFQILGKKLKLPLKEETIIDP